MDAGLLKSIQVLALKAVESPTYEDTMRSLRRWYSKTLHVDYTRMEEIPDAVVIRDYLEETYKGLYDSDSTSDHQDYDRIRTAILQNFNPVDEQVVQQEDDDWVARELAEVAEKEAKKAAKLAQAAAGPSMGPREGAGNPPVTHREPSLETPNLIPEEGSVSFEDSIPED